MYRQRHDNHVESPSSSLLPIFNWFIVPFASVVTDKTVTSMSTNGFWVFATLYWKFFLLWQQNNTTLNTTLLTIIVHIFENRHIVYTSFGRRRCWSFKQIITTAAPSLGKRFDYKVSNLSTPNLQWKLIFNSSSINYYLSLENLLDKFLQTGLTVEMATARLHGIS